jgi:tetratricopeptide (TPR) repeat protein
VLTARDYDSAVRFGRHAVVVDPDFYIARVHLSQAYIELGEYDLALDHLNSASRNGVNTKVIAMRDSIFGRTGRGDEAQGVLNTVFSIAKERFVPAFCIAMVHLGLGELEHAMQWLERGYDACDVHLAFFADRCQVGPASQ